MWQRTFRIAIVASWALSVTVAGSMIASAMWYHTAPQKNEKFKKTSSIPNNGGTINPQEANKDIVVRLRESGATVDSKNITTDGMGTWISLFELDEGETWTVSANWVADVVYVGTVTSSQPFEVVGP
jgi:hypothetical protein